jgi:hypothetical protein
MSILIVWFIASFVFGPLIGACVAFGGGEL